MKNISPRPLLLLQNTTAITAMIGSLIILVVLAINVIHSIDTLSFLLSHSR